MLNEIRFIQNVGRFETAKPTQKAKFGPCTLVFGEKRWGKSALADIFLSLKTNDPAKIVYLHLARSRVPDRGAELCAKKTIGNAIQNIKRGRRNFAEVGVDLYSALSPEDLELLALNIEKCHVIGHNLGIADEYYVELTRAVQPGETVRLIGDEIGLVADICQFVVAHIESTLLPAHESSAPAVEGQ